MNRNFLSGFVIFGLIAALCFLANGGRSGNASMSDQDYVEGVAYDTNWDADLGSYVVTDGDSIVDWYDADSVIDWSDEDTVLYDADAIYLEMDSLRYPYAKEEEDFRAAYRAYATGDYEISGKAFSSLYEQNFPYAKFCSDCAKDMQEIQSLMEDPGDLDKLSPRQLRLIGAMLLNDDTQYDWNTDAVYEVPEIGDSDSYEDTDSCDYGYDYQLMLDISAHNSQVNREFGIQLLKKAAERGDDEALMFYVAYYLYSQEGFLDEDRKAKAIAMLNENPTKGMAKAVFTIGTLYDEGMVYPYDHTKAIDYYQKAADMGNMNAMYNLGLHYCRDINYDRKKAIEYFEKAAEQNHKKALFALALIALEDKNIPLCKEYLDKAVAAGDGYAYCYIIDKILDLGVSDYGGADFLYECYAKARTQDLYDRAREVVTCMELIGIDEDTWKDAEKKFGTEEGYLETWLVLNDMAGLRDSRNLNRGIERYKKLAETDASYLPGLADCFVQIDEIRDLDEAIRLYEKFREIMFNDQIESLSEVDINDASYVENTMHGMVSDLYDDEGTYALYADDIDSRIDKLKKISYGLKNFEKVKKNAQAGNADDAYTLACMAKYSCYPEPTPLSASGQYWMNIAAINGNPAAMFEMSDFYERTDGINDVRTSYWWDKWADSEITVEE